MKTAALEEIVLGLFLENTQGPGTSLDRLIPCWVLEILIPGGYSRYEIVYKFSSLVFVLVGNYGELLRRKAETNKLVDVTCVLTGSSIVVKVVSSGTRKMGFYFWLCWELAV